MVMVKVCGAPDTREVQTGASEGRGACGDERRGPGAVPEDGVGPVARLGAPLNGPPMQRLTGQTDGLGVFWV